MSSSANRRARTERRDQDLGPPSGWKDRRRSVERRMPEIREIAMPVAEFIAILRSTQEALRRSANHDLETGPEPSAA
jgi:hypothetical protein